MESKHSNYDKPDFISVFYLFPSKFQTLDMSVVGDLTEPICLTNGWTQTLYARVSITIA